MGLLTKVQFRSFSQSRAQRTVPDTDELDHLIHTAYLKCCMATDHVQLQNQMPLSTVAGTYIYGISGALSSRLRYSSDGGRILTPSNYRRRIIPMARGEYLKVTDWDTQGIPAKFHIRRNSVWLYPNPNDVYFIEIDYWDKPAKFALDSSVSDLPDEWDEAIIRGTVALIYSRFQEHEVAMKADNDFIDYVRGLIPGDDFAPWPATPLQVATSESDLSILGGEEDA